MVMKLAYESIMAGHLAIKRTVQKALLEFFWPGIASDIQRFCQSCDICQRTIPKGKIIKAPLNKMPIIEDREDDEQSKLSSGTSQVCANSIFDMASEWSSGQVMNGLIGTPSHNGAHSSSQVSVGQRFNAGEAMFAVYLMTGIIRFYLSVRSAGDIICDVM